jgi:1,4-dihydroxy-2-naphthoate octaprenyltransferase
MSGRLNWPAFMLGIPQGFLILEVIWINQFPDYAADKETGKKNLVVRLGPEISRILYGLFMIFSFLSIPALIGFMGLSMLVILAFLAGPLAFRATQILWRQYLSHEGVIPAQALTIQTLLVQGLLISLALLLSGLVNR